MLRISMIKLLFLTLKAPITTNVVCFFFHLLKYFRSLLEKQCWPKSEQSDLGSRYLLSKLKLVLNGSKYVPGD